MPCLVIDKTSVYELDEECMREKKREKKETEEKTSSDQVQKQKK